jgi:hypothetical protein
MNLQTSVFVYRLQAVMHDDAEGNTSFGLHPGPANMALSSEAVYHVPRAVTQGPVSPVAIAITGGAIWLYPIDA